MDVMCLEEAPVPFDRVGIAGGIVPRGAALIGCTAKPRRDGPLPDDIATKVIDSD
jgi:hypothetical protein